MIIFNDKSYEKIVDNLNDGLYFVDKNMVITYWNKAAERISGFTAEEVIGTSCENGILTHINCDGHDLCRNECPLKATLSDQMPREDLVYMHHKDGHRLPVSVRVSTITDDSGDVIGGIELFTDMSSQEANELRVKELEKMAMLDNLTELANRNYLEKEFTGRFEEFRRFNVPFGVLFMDIDHFKKFNDTHGHDVGDLVLKFVADNLVKNSRPFDLYGRWGGEEFIGIIRNISSDDLNELANRIRILIEKSYIMSDNEKLSVTISIGATTVVAGDDMESIIKRADTLLYESKHAGRNRVTLG